MPLRVRRRLPYGRRQLSPPSPRESPLTEREGASPRADDSFALGSIVLAMAVARETPQWEPLFAARTRGNVGDGIATVLAFLGRPDLISFAGGFPDPLTFPRERAAPLLAECAAAGESAAFQYAPTRGLAGTLDAVAQRLEAQQGRRPRDDELLITSGAIEALELTGMSLLD